ncbi:hypothetical protein F4V91_10900 [Neorhizobium galegae]|uniref:Oligopeptide transport permease C-like N-terminal domain-containing protein n=1 Tax=Neorhizobium galegae TaxID=399 RepID=A0A6A1TQ18_NEOGA|nr:hypothetical protein [Neorhizobium galegae]KAB1086891.1 hypothetical protein F4V91_10900 [Neorhizobium galegae]
MSTAGFKDYAQHFAESRAAVVSLAVSLAFVACAIFAPLLSPTDPYDLTQLQLSDALKPTGSTRMLPGEEVRGTWSKSGGIRDSCFLQIMRFFFHDEAPPAHGRACRYVVAEGAAGACDGFGGAG